MTDSLKMRRHCEVLHHSGDKLDEPRPSIRHTHRPAVHVREPGGGSEASAGAPASVNRFPGAADQRPAGHTECHPTTSGGLMDEEKIEEMADDAMNSLDEAIEDWSVKDALAFFEFMESNIGFRIRALREDLNR